MKKHLLILIFVLAANLSFGQAVSYENFEPTANPDLMTIFFDGGGTYNETTTPPNNVTQNTSTKCAYYQRDNTNYWDYISYNLDSKMVNPDAFASASPGTNVFKFKLATTAGIGVNFIIKLESSTLTGHHSEYNAVTTATNNDWQTLTFTWLGAGNNGTLANTEVDRIIIFPASNTNSGDQFFFDDFEGPALVALGTKDASSLVSTSKLYPNPATGTANVELELKSSANVKVVLNDMYGKEVKVIAEKSSNSINESFDVSTLNKGVYVVSFLVDGAPAKSQMLVVK